MRLINRAEPKTIAWDACEAALTEHKRRFGEYARQKTKTTYRIKLRDKKITVEVVTRSASYVATAMVCARSLRSIVTA
jgi:hypothetical protein